MPQTRVSDAERIVSEKIARWTALFGARAWADLAALYADRALFYGSAPQLYAGRAAIESYFRALPDEILLEGFAPPVAADLAPGLVGFAGDVDFTLPGRPLPFRMMWTIRVAADGTSAIVSHHAAPRTAGLG